MPRRRRRTRKGRGAVTAADQHTEISQKKSGGAIGINVPATSVVVSVCAQFAKKVVIISERVPPKPQADAERAPRREVDRRRAGNRRVGRAVCFVSHYCSPLSSVDSILIH